MRRAWLSAWASCESRVSIVSSSESSNSHSTSVDVDGAVMSVADDDAELDDNEDAEAVADVKEEWVLGTRSSGCIVVSIVSHWSSSGLKLRSRSPRPSILFCGCARPARTGSSERRLIRRRVGSSARSLSLIRRIRFSLVSTDSRYAASASRYSRESSAGLRLLILLISARCPAMYSCSPSSLNSAILVASRARTCSRSRFARASSSLSSLWAGANRGVSDAEPTGGVGTYEEDRFEVSPEL